MGASRKGKKQFLNPEGVPKPTGYTQVVTTGPGRMVFISGQGGAATDGQMPDDFSAQTRNTFENIGRCLAAAGAKFDDIVKINYYVTDLAYTTELRRIRSGYLNTSAPPASTLVQVGLGKGLKVEIEAIAIVPE
ncbi:MAG: RidA family protein [Acidimicrobiia bacterium]|nr:RidA family protein [Acidimicrobiia bacterium]